MQQLLLGHCLHLVVDNWERMIEELDFAANLVHISKAQLGMTQEHAVLAANDAFYRAFEKRDLEAMTAVWSQGTGSLCIHPGRNAIKGWEAISSSWAGIFRNTSYLEIETEIIRTEVNGNLAYVVLIETVLQVAGGRRAKAQSIATNVFECMAQNWYLVHHHGSPLLG